MATSPANRTSTWRSIWLAGVWAALLSAVGNALLYLLAPLFGFSWQSVPVATPMGENPISLVQVVIASVLPAIAATLLFVLLVRFTPRPGLIFGVLAALVFVAMFFGPLGIPGAPAGMVTLLELMHVVSAAAVVGLLFRSLRAKTPEL